MRANENKNLKLSPGVVLTPSIEPVIAELDKYFNFPALVTSGLRDADSQLKIIRGYLEQKGLRVTYPEAFEKEVNEKYYDDQYGQIYYWQKGWSKLLNIGLIINPPCEAACLYDYYRNGINKKGQFIHASPHFRGKAFDIGGAYKGELIIDKVIQALHKALADKVPGLINILVERENNCVHCDVA